MRKRVLLQTAVLLAATVNFSYVAASCVPPAKGQTPLDVLKCLQSELDTQQKRIAELEKENQALRQKTDAISVSSNGNVGIGTTSPKAKLQIGESTLNGHRHNEHMLELSANGWNGTYLSLRNSYVANGHNYLLSSQDELCLAKFGEE
jgi:hypothetical protein